MTNSSQAVRNLLQAYAEKGFFRELETRPSQGNVASFNIRWHYNRNFIATVDYDAGAIVFDNVLPNVPITSPMYKALQAFVANLASTNTPAHRRIEQASAVVACENREGNVVLRLDLAAGDYEYGLRKIVQAVHEVYFDFLTNGPYYEYQIAQLGLDPDALTFS